MQHTVLIVSGIDYERPDGFAIKHFDTSEQARDYRVSIEDLENRRYVRAVILGDDTPFYCDRTSFGHAACGSFLTIRPSPPEEGYKANRFFCMSNKPPPDNSPNAEMVVTSHDSMTVARAIRLQLNCDHSIEVTLHAGLRKYPSLMMHKHRLYIHLRTRESHLSDLPEDDGKWELRILRNTLTVADIAAILEQHYTKLFRAPKDFEGDELNVAPGVKFDRDPALNHKQPESEGEVR